MCSLPPNRRLSSRRWPKILMNRILLVLVLAIVALPSVADSVTFNTVALQQQGFVKVPLGEGLNPLLYPDVLGNQHILTFESLLGPVGAVVFSSVLTLAGQQQTFGPFTFDCTNPAGCGVIFSWILPASYKVTPGTLSVTLNGTISSYNFRYQTAVPEPSTLALIGLGSLAVFWRKRRAI